MKDKANKGYWQRLAKIYAPLMESDKKFYNAICGYIRDYLKSDMNVLELACGTGQLSFPLSDCTNSWKMCIRDSHCTVWKVPGTKTAPSVLTCG